MALLLAAGVSTPGAAQPEGKDALPLVIEAIKSEIAQAQEDRSDQGLMLKIERAVVTLRVASVHQAGASGGPSFTIAGLDFGASAGTSTTRQKSTILVLDLKPDEDVLVSSAPELGLAAAIRRLKTAIRVAMDTRPYMELAKATVDLEFGLERQADGELKFIIASGEAQAQSVTAHHVELSLVPLDF